MCARVETTVCWLVSVPVEVIETGVSAGRPAATSSAAISRMDPTAESRTRVWWVAWCAQSTLASLQVTTATSRWFFVVSGMPAYVGTALTEETPGTISNPISALVQAWASSGPEA
jgi:hypothetical protein